MKKNLNLSRILCATLSVCTVGSFIGCNRDQSDTMYNEKIDINKSQLYISNYDGGVGSEWLSNVEARFEAAYANKSFEKGKTGVQVMVRNHKVKSGGTNPNLEGQEVFFGEAVPYYDFVTSGSMLDITDVVQKVLAQDGVSLTADMDAAIKLENKYFGLPHYEVFGGVTYNQDVFDEYQLYIAKDGSYVSAAGDLSVGPDGLAETSDDGLPATIEEFLTLCEYMNTTAQVTPFILTGEYAHYYAAFLLDALLGAYGGKEALIAGVTGQGVLDSVTAIVEDSTSPLGLRATVTKDKAVESVVDMFNTPGKLYALGFLKELLDKGYFDVDGLKSTETHLDAQEDYINSAYESRPIAMLIEGSWWENEASAAFESLVSRQGAEASAKNSHYSFMPLPTKLDENDTNDNRTPAYYSAYNVFAFIKGTIAPEKVDLAKEFLYFCYTTEELEAFTAQTGVARGLQYNISEGTRNSLSTLSQSTWEIHERGVVLQISNSELYKTKGSSFADENKWKAVSYDFPYNYFRVGDMSAKDYFESGKILAAK